VKGTHQLQNKIL